MNRNKVPFWRLVRLDESIRAGRHPNCASVAREMEVSSKTIQRDIDFMRDRLGAPIEFDPARNGYYYTDKTWFLPALEMSEGELVYLMLGVRALQQYRGAPVAAKLDRVFEKIAALLPNGVSIRPELLASEFTFTGPPAKPVDEEVWITVVRGLRSRRSVDIRYRAFDSPRATDRRIDPYHIANLQGEWYVMARCHLRNEERQFAIPRIERATLTTEAFEMAKDCAARRAVSGAFARFASRAPARTVRVLFDRDIANRVSDCRWHPTQTLKRRRDGGVELTFRAGGLLEIQRWVLGWGRHARVLAPAELRRAVTAEVQAMANHQRQQGGSS